MQGIENTWWGLKRSMPRTGTSKDLFDSYLQECLWRQHYKSDPFGKIIEHLADLYNVTLEPSKHSMLLSRSHPNTVLLERKERSRHYLPLHYVTEGKLK